MANKLLCYPFRNGRRIIISLIIFLSLQAYSCEKFIKDFQNQFLNSLVPIKTSKISSGAFTQDQSSEILLSTLSMHETIMSHFFLQDKLEYDIDFQSEKNLIFYRNQTFKIDSCTENSILFYEDKYDDPRSLLFGIDPYDQGGSYCKLTTQLVNKPYAFVVSCLRRPYQIYTEAEKIIYFTANQLFVQTNEQKELERIHKHTSIFFKDLNTLEAYQAYFFRD